MLIEAPDFVVDHELRIFALQGDCELETRAGPGGGRYVIRERNRAHQACVDYLARLRQSDAHMGVIPELAIPISTVPHVLATLREFPRSMLFIGGVEGLTRQEYGSLLDGIDDRETQPLAATAAGDYVNALLIAIKTPTRFLVRLRAKRVPSRVENREGPPMAVGAGPFTTVRLGTAPIVVVPLVCSEFVWPEQLWTLLANEVAGNIDIIPVLQRNNDAEGRHVGPQLHHAYTQEAKTANARFVLANQAIGESSDGTCYVVVPPTAPADPSFDHAFRELWYLPAPRTYKGFRIPDRTGCIWSARIVSPHALASALGNRICAGSVTEVLTPTDDALWGLSAGLMRSSTLIHHRSTLRKPHTEVRDAIAGALDMQSPTFVLRGLTTESANDVFYRMRCAEWPIWESVEGVVEELIEVAALLAAGGDDVALIPCDGGNCKLTGRSIAILYAPNVDSALSARFGPQSMFDATTNPAGVVLLGVVLGASDVGVCRIGDVLRADRVTSSSPDLVDTPSKTDESSVTIRIDDVEFRSTVDVRPNMNQQTVAAARHRLQTLFPKVYS